MLLIKKMCRDLWNMKSQFLSIFLMCMLGVLIYSGIECVWYGMEVESDKYFAETNLADVWLNGNNITYSDKNRIEGIESVEQTQLSAVYDSFLDENNEENIRLIANAADNISKPYNYSGKKYDPNGDGIWLDKDYADAKDVSVGDFIRVYDDEKNFKLKVEGLVYSPEYISYTGTLTSIIPKHEKYTFGYVSLDTLQDINSSVRYNQLKMVVEEDTDFYELKTRIHSLLEEKYINCIELSEFNQVYSFVSKIQQIKKMAIMFSVIFLLLAILCIRTTMKRIVQKQRIQIGILKAVGIYNFAIKIHYAMYGFIVSIIATLLGYILAPRTIAPVLLDLQKDFYSMPKWSIISSNYSIVLIVLMVLICTITAWLSCTNIAKEVPAQSLRNQVIDSNKKTFIENIEGLWNNLSFEWRWVLRDASRNKARTLIAIVGVFGSMMLLIASLGLQDSINKNNDVIYNEQYTYYKQLTVSPLMTEEDKAEIEQKLFGDYQWVMSISGECKNSKNIGTVNVFVIDKGYYYNIKNANHISIELPEDGLVVSKQTAKELEIKKNEYINLLYKGTEIPIKVSDIQPIGTPQGLFCSKEYWQDLGLEFVPNTLLTGKSKNLSDIEEESFVKETVEKSVQVEEADRVIDSVRGVIILLIMAAISLSVVILYNLALLNFSEKYREYATLKVLGAFNAEIKGVIYKGSVLNVLLGWIIGTVVGWYFLKLYVYTISTTTTVYSPFIKVSSYICATLVALGCSIFVNFVVARKAIAIDMVESLKSVE
ncbi:putative ABC transport system permease protein [Pseudobutyrivibrio sp. NOR37]|uniref:ABC transporter permease n=3 Tax=Lachnospiraceae TaxID=186803 RepID=A0A2G3EC71_9FIRM|nr:ABC transporter permease [Pseudobutyrivibrio ruminis]NEX01821.1 ABC transporter permease [Pseudobutyrivibrio xylanivorans]PHU40892.1 ABC transporter permease [Pseudobutyrivibrio ruminis]SFR71990.1 putative ABC transport system permease protein [Pseudobutyrivibrio sp. NOR37]